MADFPKRDAAWNRFRHLLDGVDDDDLRVRLLLAAHDYGHFSATEAIDNCTSIIRETMGMQA